MRMTKWQRIAKARMMGCKMPWRAYKAGKVAGVPFWVICAFLEQETSGGQNVFGQDPTIYVRAGYVTKDKYLAYKAKRKQTGLMQGVGPMQLTWYAYQDMADNAGGCWKPYYNILTAARILNKYKTSDSTWRDVALRYNTGLEYVREIGPKLDKWRNAFEGK